MIRASLLFVYDCLFRSRLSAQIEKIPPQDSFHASKQVCHLLRSGVAALFGPESGEKRRTGNFYNPSFYSSAGTTSTHIQSICDAMEIPHIETRWDFRVRRDDYSINLYPNPKVISKVRIVTMLNVDVDLKRDQDLSILSKGSKERMHLICDLNLLHLKSLNLDN